MPRKAPFLPLCLLAGCATPQVQEPAPALDYACSDLVVIGRIETVDAKPIADPGEALPGWRSAYQLEIRIKRIVQGHESRRAVSASAIAHARIRDDKDFLIVLHPDGTGNYALESASLWKTRPRLSESCS